MKTIQDLWRDHFGGFWPVFHLLERQYGGPDRHYHTLDHLRHMFAVADQIATDLTPRDLQVLRLAIWCHDAIQDPRANQLLGTDVPFSAEFGRRVAVELQLPKLAGQVAEAIQTTVHKGPCQGSRVAQILCDCDLAILGESPWLYARYAEAIRLEYGHLTPEELRDGRGAFLRAMLARPFIFTTAIAHECYESQARANIEGEIKRLAAGGI